MFCGHNRFDIYDESKQLVKKKAAKKRVKSQSQSQDWGVRKPVEATLRLFESEREAKKKIGIRLKLARRHRPQQMRRHSELRSTERVKNLNCAGELHHSWISRWPVCAYYSMAESIYWKNNVPESVLEKKRVDTRVCKIDPRTFRRRLSSSSCAVVIVHTHKQPVNTQQNQTSKPSRWTSSRGSQKENHNQQHIFHQDEQLS